MPAFPADPDRLRQAVAAIFRAAGLAAEDAGWVAHCLVLADLRGVGTHGTARLPIYVERLRNGAANPRPRLRLTRPAPAALHVQGDNALGFVAARFALDEAIALARAQGIAIVGVGDSAHFGMAATYLLRAVEAGMGALVFTNASPSMPIWGGRTPFLGTSPFAFGMPGGTDSPPILLDMATSVAARGKIRQAAAAGQPIPEGWALDAEGNPTTDSQRAYDGILLPLGGPKGSGLSLMMEIMAGVLTGGAFGGQVRDQYKARDLPQKVGHSFILFRPDLFMPADEIRARMDDLVARARACAPLDPARPILMPGEPEAATMQARLKTGIPLTEAVVTEILHEAARAGIPLAAADLHMARGEE